MFCDILPLRKDKGGHGMPHKTISFSLNGMLFEYDEEKNRQNIKKHGISFRSAARVFFDFDRIEFYDEASSAVEDRYDTIGDTSAGHLLTVTASSTTIGNVDAFTTNINDILYVVYTERIRAETNGKRQEVIRLISARMATSFERGLYYGKQE
jgi:uncharacterized DUF497 family protein